MNSYGFAHWEKLAYAGCGVVAGSLAGYFMSPKAVPTERTLEQDMVIRAIFGEYEVLRSENEELVTATDELQVVIDKLQQVVDMLTAQNQGVQEENLELTETCAKLSDDMKKLHQEYTQELGERKRLEQELAGVHNLQEELEQQRQEVENANAALCDNVLEQQNSLVSSSERLQKMMDNLMLQVNEVVKEKTSMVSCLDGLQSKIATWKTTYSKRVPLKKRFENVEDLKQQLAGSRKAANQSRQRSIDKIREGLGGEFAKREKKSITSFLY